MIKKRSLFVVGHLSNAHSHLIGQFRAANTPISMFLRGGRKLKNLYNTTWTRRELHTGSKPMFRINLGDAGYGRFKSRFPEALSFLIERMHHHDDLKIISESETSVS